MTQICHQVMSRTAETACHARLVSPAQGGGLGESGCRCHHCLCPLTCLPSGCTPGARGPTWGWGSPSISLPALPRQTPSLPPGVCTHNTREGVEVVQNFIEQPVLSQMGSQCPVTCREPINGSSNLLPVWGGQGLVAYTEIPLQVAVHVARKSRLPWGTIQAQGPVPRSQLCPGHHGNQQ